MGLGGPRTVHNSLFPLASHLAEFEALALHLLDDHHLRCLSLRPIAILNLRQYTKHPEAYTRGYVIFGRVR
jgi:hypothetical protein